MEAQDLASTRAEPALSMFVLLRFAVLFSLCRLLLWNLLRRNSKKRLKSIELYDQPRFVSLCVDRKLFHVSVD